MVLFMNYGEVLESCTLSVGKYLKANGLDDIIKDFKVESFSILASTESCLIVVSDGDLRSNYFYHTI